MDFKGLGGLGSWTGASLIDGLDGNGAGFATAGATAGLTGDATARSGRTLAIT
jgi:hypothetical protein